MLTDGLADDTETKLLVGEWCGYDINMRESKGFRLKKKAETVWGSKKRERKGEAEKERVYTQINGWPVLCCVCISSGLSQ